MKIVVITGLSGAGKSAARTVMEDLNFYCIDNLPPSMMPSIVEYMNANHAEYKNVTFVVDIRGGKFFKDLQINLELLKKSGNSITLLYFEASNDVLLRRFKEVRRTHPIDGSMRLEEAIEKERQILSELRDRADHIFNTDVLNMNELRSAIVNELGDNAQFPFHVNLFSFGFKNGCPKDADFVFDLRFLKNPFYIPELKDLTGNEKNVRDYVMSFDESRKLYNHILEMIKFTLPLIKAEGRTQLAIGLGCTGGRQRSVTFVNLLTPELTKMGYQVKCSHRELCDG